MMILLSILKGILWIFLILLLSVLCIPVEYGFSGYKDEEYELRGEISWLFRGLKASILKKSGSKMAVALNLLGFKITPKDHLSKPSKKKKEKKEKKEKKSKRKRELKDFISKPLLHKVLDFIGSILKHIRPRVLSIDGRIGFDDPYYTGLIAMFLYSLAPSLNDYPIHVVPVFEEETLEGRFQVQGRIIMAVLVFVSIRLLLSKPVRNIFMNKKEEKSHVI